MFRGLPLELDLLFLCVCFKSAYAFLLCGDLCPYWNLDSAVVGRATQCVGWVLLVRCCLHASTFEVVLGNFVKARLPREKLRGVAIAALHVSATANESNTRNSKETWRAVRFKCEYAALRSKRNVWKTKCPIEKWRKSWTYNFTVEAYVENRLACWAC